jgi:LuxR family maltose regulon positive regulatory protein
MDLPPAVTNVQAPSWQDSCVPRARLTQRLDDALARGARITLITAPAGYGKTTLAAEWVSSLGCPVAWVSLDERDSSSTDYRDRSG